MLKNRSIVCSGLHGPAKAWWISEQLQRGESAIVVCPSHNQAERFADELAFFLGSKTARFFPSWQILPFEKVSPDRDLMATRMGLLLGADRGHSGVWVVSVEVLSQKVHPRNRLYGLFSTISIGDKIDLDSLNQLFLRCGYRRAGLVESVGDFAIRGMVIDLFSPSQDTPVRVYIEDACVTRLRRFDPNNQRTEQDLESVEISPVTEWVSFSRSNVCKDLVLDRIRQRGGELGLPSRIVQELESCILNDYEVSGIESLQSLLYGDFVPITDHLPDDSSIFFDDRSACFRALESFWDKLNGRALTLSNEKIMHPRISDLYLSPSEIATNLNCRKVADLDGFIVDDEGDIGTFLGAEDARVVESKKLRSQRKITFRTSSNNELESLLKSRVGGGQALLPLKKRVQEWKKKGFRIVFVVGALSRAERLSSILDSLGIASIIFSEPLKDLLVRESGSVVAIMEGNISDGVQIPSERLVIIGEHEIFHDRSVRRRKTKSASMRRILHSLRELKEKDYVVHRDYGIGIYQGLEKRLVEGTIGDFLAIEYADSRLFVPIQNIGRVQRFLGIGNQPPSLDRLGSKRWARAKEKVREATISLAGDLLKLYATRTTQRGWHFDYVGADDESFADGFPYDETPDQARAINETLTDMASDKAMDRLICGDVGFGKTEIAIRAAFKAFQHKKQTVLLVPTTILVEQHRRSFEERFLGYPAKIGAISRFYPERQNKETLQKLAEGEIDVIIGTHRLLQPDVNFYDLGLLIIDEEHRFGVRQKERLRQVRTGVDTLTMTATPIPRTLHLSLMGVRDVSVLRTPPVDRRPIRTCIANDDSSTVRDAISRELSRGGQIFFLHNRVQTLASRTQLLSDLFPDARVQYAHGQMPENLLEDVMKRFCEGEIDILVTTTIIESGLDVPNANTIIVDDAHLYGLAQLYQIRGRVGRGTRQAYAYFLIPSRRALSHEAHERLKVLQSFEDLGVGFQLAMRDLEIRGAGNLLGKEQSGSIGAVGFELFTDLLREAVCQLRGDDEALTSDHVGSIDPEVKIPLDAFIPEPYIPDVAERLLLYQRLAMILESHEADEILNELRDRFGDPDEEVVNLVHVMSYRGLLRRFGIAKAEVVGLNLTLSLTQSSPLDPQALISLTKINPHMYKLGRNLSLIVKFAEENSDINSLYRFTEQLLNSLRPESKESNKSTRGAGVVTNQLTSLGESFERDQKHGTQW